MALGDIFKFSRKTFFNPRGWLGYDELKAYNRVIFSVIGNLFVKPQPERTETFTEAMQRQNLTEADINETAKRYLNYTVFFVILAGVSLAGGFFMLFTYRTIAGLFLAIACTALFLVQAFRFHFWHFQIVHRTLGCTFEEWWQGKLKPDSRDQ